MMTALHEDLVLEENLQLYPRLINVQIYDKVTELFLISGIEKEGFSQVVCPILAKFTHVRTNIQELHQLVTNFFNN